VLKDYLQIKKIQTLLGGSLGGQQALEWSIINPSLIENLILIATNAKHSPWGIAFNESQRSGCDILRRNDFWRKKRIDRRAQYCLT